MESFSSSFDIKIHLCRGVIVIFYGTPNYDEDHKELETFKAWPRELMAPQTTQRLGKGNKKKTKNNKTLSHTHTQILL